MSIPPVSNKGSASHPAGKSPMEIVESKEFERDADAALSPIERRAIYLSLAENPLVGTPLKQSPALRGVPFFGHVVVYAVSPNLGKLFLLILEKGKDLSPSEDDDENWKKVKTGVRLFVKGGIFAGGKKALEWLLELLN